MGDATTWPAPANVTSLGRALLLRPLGFASQHLHQLTIRCCPLLRSLLTLPGLLLHALLGQGGLPSLLGLLVDLSPALLRRLLHRDVLRIPRPALLGFLLGLPPKPPRELLSSEGPVARI